MVQRDTATQPAGPNSVELRRLGVDDLSAAELVSDLTFSDRDGPVEAGSWPGRRSDLAVTRWIDRVRHYLRIDPNGCWIATHGDEIVGFAISQNREGIWYLATYGVLPGHQGRGIGRRLMDAVLEHAGGRPGLFSATPHPGATRRYLMAGFSLLPQMRMTGTVDRSSIPAVAGLQEGKADDFEWMDSLDARVRGGGHGPDHQYLLDHNRLIVSRDSIGRGYVYADENGRALLLAAEDPQTAQRLLWECLASTRGETLINCITPANQWAVEVGVAARLNLGQEGFLALRGLAEPAPYLASGQVL